MVNQIVADLVADAANPPELAVLSGFLGDSSVAGRERLYTTSALDEWYEIPADQIKRRAEIGPHPESPLGNDVVWLSRADAAALTKQRRTVEGVGLAVARPTLSLPRPTPTGITVNFYLGGGAPAGDGGGGLSFGGGDDPGLSQLFPPKP